MSTFRDAIARQIEADWEVEAETVYPHDDAPYTVVAVIATPDELADAVLAMPEMEAIRKALREIAQPYHFSSARAVLGTPPFNLPESVIAWVLGGDQ